MIQKKLFLNPVLVFSATWLLVVLLFELRLSSRLTASHGTILTLFLLFLGGYVIGGIAALLTTGRIHLSVNRELTSTQRRGTIWLLFGVLFLALLEIAIEGFIPAFAMLRNASVSHFEFGIPSVHGLVIAGLSAIGAIFFAEFCRTGMRRALWLSFIPIAYGILFVSRKMFTVCFVEYLLAFLIYRPISPKAIVGTIGALMTFIFLFGAVGSLRGSGSALDTYGGFSHEFEFVGDSGFKWVYLYMTTPLENLSHTTENFPPEDNVSFSRTFSSIVPSAIAKLFRNDTRGANTFALTALESYWLKSAVFNVSTGFNDPYLDQGKPGIFLYAAFMGFLTSISFCLFRGPIGVATYAALLAGSLLTVFSNSFSNLNYAGQFLFFAMACRPFVLRRRSPPLPTADTARA